MYEHRGSLKDTVVEKPSGKKSFIADFFSASRSDLFKRLSPDRRKSPKNSSENLSEAGVGMNTSLDGARDSPFSRSFAKKIIQGGSGVNENMNEENGVTIRSSKKFSPRRSLRRLKHGKSKTNNLVLENTQQRARSSSDTTSKCNQCQQEINMSMELTFVSFGRKHYHKACFKCVRCETPLMLKNARKESGSGLLCDSCPIHDEASKSGAEVTKNTENFFNLLEKMQGGRLDEQRCSFHIASAALLDQPQQVVANKSQEYPSIEDVLKQDGPYPQIIPPPNGGYWIQGFTSSCSHLKTADENLEVYPTTESKIYIDDTKHIYRNHFIGSDHCNFSAKDLTNEKIGHVVMSVKFENDKVKSKEKNYGKCRIILRCQEDTYSGVFTINQESGGLMQWAKELCPELNVERFEAINSANCWNTILAFDEHNEVAHCKFGLLYQLPNQTKEEELFSNNEESPAFKEFLDFLGDRIELTGHTGFRGGLDVFNGHTGKQSIYRNFRGQEVMFHVSTMLPYVDGDRQQLQRKRHIGNDVVSLVFQEGNTPFVPNMITTRFLHAYIVIQPVQPCTANTRYKVSVTARSDVPTFSPELPAISVFKKDQDFKDWLYCKLINGQAHCYKSVKFSHMQRRTRAMLMTMLYKDLREGTDLLLDPSANVDTISISSISSETVSSSNKESSTSFYETFKKLANRRRRNSEDLNSSPTIFNSKAEKTLPKSNCDEIQSSTNPNNTYSNQALKYDEKRKDNLKNKMSKSLHENSNNSSNTFLNGTKSLNTLLVDKRETQQLCLSNSSLNFGSISEKKVDKKSENRKLQNEIDILKKQLLQYKNVEKENTTQKKEIQMLRNEIRQLTVTSPKLKLKGVTATTEEHLV